MLELFAFGDAGWGDELLAGLMVTIQLAVVSLPVGLLLGFLAAGATLSPRGWLRAIGTGYTTVMRGLPELLTLFVVYNGLGLLLNAVVTWWNPEGAAVELSPFVAGVIALGLVFGAFAGEVLRGAFQALQQGPDRGGQGGRDAAGPGVLPHHAAAGLALRAAGARQPVDQPAQGHRARLGDRARRPDAHDPGRGRARPSSPSPSSWPPA